MPCPAKSDSFAVDHSNPPWALLRCRVDRCSLVRVQRIVQLAVGPAAAQGADQGHRVDEATFLDAERALLVGQLSLLGKIHGRVVQLFGARTRREAGALSDLQGHSIQVEPVFTMGVSVWVGGYGLVAPCGPCVTTETCPTPGGVGSFQSDVSLVYEVLCFNK